MLVRASKRALPPPSAAAATVPISWYVLLVPVQKGPLKGSKVPLALARGQGIKGLNQCSVRGHYYLNLIFLETILVQAH